MRSTPVSIQAQQVAVDTVHADDESAVETVATSPRIAIIIVTWNRRQDVSSVLEALSRQDYDRSQMHVVVVDNASTDDTTDFLTDLWAPEQIVPNPTSHAHEPDFQRPVRLSDNGRTNRGGFASLTIVRNSRNHGGCGGFNTGFAYVDHALHGTANEPDYVWLVDDDVDLAADTLSQLTRVGEQDSTIGIVGTRMVDLGGRSETIESTIYFNGRRGWMQDEPPTHHRLHASHQRWVQQCGGPKGKGPYSGVREVDVASACSLLARWSAVREVGFWDHRFFIYCDDADWCLRFSRAGYRVVCNLDAVVYHTPWHYKTTPARIYYSQRNAVWLVMKNVPKPRAYYTAGRWVASILVDALLASLHRRTFHAEIIRRTAHDISTNHGGRLEEEGPPLLPLAAALGECGLVSNDPDASKRDIVVLCSLPESVTWADELRKHVEEYLESTHAGELNANWVYVVRNDVPDPTAAEPGAPRRVVYGKRIRSKLKRQVEFLKEAPGAVVVFNQTNDFPLLRGANNLHVDRKHPDVAQLEPDGIGVRARFFGRWIGSVACAAWWFVTMRKPKRVGRYG